VAKTTERLVLSFDAETRSFKPAAHNLLSPQAVELADKLQTAEAPARIVEQKNHHRVLNPRKCRPCKKAAELATANHTEPPAEQTEQEQPPASEEESESD
jgi:hypothetical protein